MLSRVGLSALLAVLTPASALQAAATVLINEVHYHPADDTQTSEFLELYNYGTSEADVSGWALLGGITFIFPAGTSLEPDEYVLIAADPAALEDAYSADRDLSAVRIFGPYDGSLSNGGERIELWTVDGYLSSFVQYSDSEPWPEDPDGLGPSLERISALREESDPEAWAASIPVGGTPGEPNSVRVEDPAPPGSPVVWIPQGATWSFFRGRSEPPASWASLGFDDSAWETGTAGFGYAGGDEATELSDMRGQYTTVYVRREFQIQDPRTIATFVSTVAIDDGCVVYLNGIEVDRYNTPGPPGSPLPYDAVSAAPVADATIREVDLSSVIDLLVEGTNVLAVQGINASLDNRDFSLHPSLAGSFRSGAATDLTYVQVGDEWQYFRGTQEPPADWTILGFDDSAWEVGPSGIGYGDGDDATVLDDMLGGYLTVYARRNFQVADATKITALTLSVDYDDGFTAYLNGREVARANVTGSGHDVTAITSREAGSFESFPIASPTTSLRTGMNILAIVGHNQALDSSDFSLVPDLSATVAGDDPNPPPDAPPKRPPRTIVINELIQDANGAGWVELYNRTEQPIDAAGMLLERFPAASGRKVLPSGSLVPAHGRLVVSEANLGFPLADAPILILATGEGYFLDAINPRSAPPGLSTGRWPDGDDNRFVFRVPTPGDPNEVALETRVVINEIQFHPSEANEGGEFIELYNRSATDTVSLKGWSFTRGIEFALPDDAAIPPQGYLVIARDPLVAEAYYSIPRPVGPYDGRLRNDAETLLLRDELKNPVDRVRFADEGSWPEATDGTGPSAELRHPDLENRYGPAWAASDGDGTPGAPNSRRENDPGPIVVGVQHEPVVPAPSEPVLVTAIVSDDRSVPSATLHWRTDGSTTTHDVPMVDDGVGDDGIAANGVFGAMIPGQSALEIIWFWITASATGGQSVTVPRGAPDPAFLYQVEPEGVEQVRPLYRIVMKGATLQEFRTRSSGSDVLLDLTFISGGRAYYNRGIRLRGASARSCNPRSYRIQFDHDVDLHGIKRLNVNGCNAYRQWIGQDFLRRTGIATPASWFRKVAFNAQLEQGVHLRVEALDEQFLERAFPGDDGGNLYRGISQANLDYRGEAFSQYRSNYEKHSNEEQADWSDIVDLSYRFDASTTPAAEFPAAIEEAIDVEEWALYFAAYAILGSTENSILLNNGDDYFLYHRPSDGKWLILPWDLDSCLDEEGQVLFRPTVDQIERFLEHPLYAPLYWCYLGSLLGSAFEADRMQTRIDHLVPLFSDAQVRDLRAYVPARRSYIDARIRDALTLQIVNGGRICSGTLIVTGPTLRVEGVAPGCGTTAVLVNDHEVSYNPQTNVWATTIDPAPSSVTVSAVTRDGFLVATRVLEEDISAGATPLPSTISSELVLDVLDPPYIVSGQVTITASGRLVVRPGVTILFEADASIVADGPLEILGTAAQPVRLEPGACSDGLGGIVLNAGASGSLIGDVELRNLYGASGRPAAITAEGARVDILDTTVVGQPGRVAIEARSGADVQVTRLGTTGFGTPIRATSADLTVQECTFSGATQSAVSFEGGATGSVSRSLFLGNGTAVLVTSNATASLDHLTAIGPGVGVDIRERTAGAGGGTIVGHSLIVWGTNPSVAEGPGSSADIAYSNLSGGTVRPGLGNIAEDPRFHDSAADDYRLSFFSPSRGTGLDGSDMGAFPYEPLGESGSFLRCDSNGDRRNDLSDGVFTLLYLFQGAQAPLCEPSSDCNGDGAIDVSDVIFNLNYLFVEGEPPPAPYPNCEVVPVAVCPVDICR